jgi:hypothetical protein
MAFDRLRRGGSAGLLALVRCELAAGRRAVVWILVCAIAARVGVVNTQLLLLSVGPCHGRMHRKKLPTGRPAREQHYAPAKNVRRILLAGHRW